MARPSRASAMVSLIDVACGSFGGLLLVSLVMIRVAPQPPEEPATGVVTIEWFLAEPCRSDEWVVESKGKRITKDKEETVDDDNAVLWSTTPAGVPGFSLRIRVPSALQETFSVEVDTRPCGTSDVSLIARQPRVRISGTLVSKAVRDALERGEVDLRCEGGVCTSLIVTIDPLETDVGQFMKCGCGRPVVKRRRSRVGAANAAQAAMTDVMFSGIGIAGAILLIFVLARRPLIPPAESTMHVDVRLTSEVLKKATLAVIVRMPDGRVFANDHNEVNLDVGGQVAFEPRRTSDWTVVFGSEPPLGTTMTVVLADVDESSGVAWDVESAGAEIKSVFPTQVTVNMTLKRETGFAAAFEYAQGDRDAPASWRAWTGDAGSVQGPVRGSMAFGAATRVPNRPTSDPTGVFSKHLFKWNGTTLVEVSEGDVMTQAEVAVAWEQERGGRLDVWTGARSVVQHHRKRHQQQWRFGIEQGAAQTGQDDDKTLEKVEALVAREARNSTIANGGWSTWKTEPVGGVTFLIQDGPGASLLDNAVRVGTGACEWSIQPGVLGDPESIKTHVVEPLRDALQSQSGLRIGVGSVGGKICVVSGQEEGELWAWTGGSERLGITPMSQDIPWWLIRADSTLVAADSRLAKPGYRLNASDLMPLAAMSFEACRKHGLRQNPRLRVSRATN